MVSAGQIDHLPNAGGNWPYCLQTRSEGAVQASSRLLWLLIVQAAAAE